MTCVCTVSRVQPTSSLPDSSMTTATSRPTASRTADQSSPLSGSTFCLGTASLSCLTSRRRNRSSRSPGPSRSRQAAHARRCRSRWQSSRLHTRCRHPARGWGSNHFRQMRQGRFRIMSPWLYTGGRCGHQNTARLQWNYVEYFRLEPCQARGKVTQPRTHF